MSWLIKILRSSEWRSWSRRKKVIAIVILACIVVALICPEMSVFAGLLDVSLLDVLITILGVQLVLYSAQIKAGFHLTGQAMVRRYRAFKRP